MSHILNPSLPENQPNPRVQGWEPVLRVPVGVTLPNGADAWRKGPVAAVRHYPLGRWRLNLSHASRWPTWTEVRDAIRALVPRDGWMAVVFAPGGHALEAEGGTVTVVEVKDQGLGRDVIIRPGAEA